jgi:beta-lactamase regulating signal transducer with metallopeptidase domain
MSLFFQYIVKLSISLAVVYLFYHFLLRRLTLYNSKRWYLLLYSFASFLIPLINITSVVKDENFEASPIVGYIPAVAGGISANNSHLPQVVSYQDMRLAGQCTLALLVIGMAVMMLRLIIQYLSFLKIKRSSKLLLNERVRIFQVNSEIIPFTIGNSIFINQHLHTEDELKEIIHHEFIHVKQNHTVDIFLSELLCVINWYNPFAWLIRRAIKENLEFIADSKVLETGLDRKQYQRLLLKVIGISKFSISTQFNFSSLKKRIAMMNKKQSAKSQLLKLLLLLPVLGIVLLAFRNPRTSVVRSEDYKYATIYIDTIPAPPASPTPAIADKNPLNEFLKKNPTVKDAYVRNGSLVIELKSGKKETYNIQDKAAFAAAEKKYGKIPLPPAPPLPPSAPTRPALPEDVKSITITEEKAVVVLSNGKLEEYELRQPEEHMAFDKKYRQSKPMLEEETRKLQEEKMELALKFDDMVRRREDRAKDKNELRQRYLEELNELRERRGEDMERKAKETEEQLELSQQKLQREIEQNEQLRRREFENAIKQEGADVDKLRKEYESKRGEDMRRKDMQLRKEAKEGEMQLRSMKEEFERADHAQADQFEREHKDMMNDMRQLQDEKESMELKLQLDSRNLSKEDKQRVISRLQEQKAELNKMVDDLKARQIQLNKQIQDLQKSEKKKS